VDGESFSSDLEYGNLDSDRELEAAVGRYPDNVSRASLLFHRSLTRETEKDALVMGEYLHSNWPVILGTLGGGMWDAKNIESVLKKEGFETTRLVERRSDPVEFLLSLTPASISAFLDETDSLEDTLKQFVTDNTAKTVKNAVIFVKTLQYAEHTLEIYLEHDWSTFRIDVDRGMERVQALEVPEGETTGAVVQKTVMEAIYAFIWPEPHETISAGNIEENLDSDIIYYSGVGDGDRWILPNNDSSLVKDRYNGSNSFGPEDVSSVENAIVWDGSDLSATGDMRRKFLGKGASTFLGFSTVNYNPYSSVMSRNFFRNGETVGASVLDGVNSLRRTSLVYSPNAVRTGVREKMARSLRLYGNPEMEKDPLPEEALNYSRSCEDVCTLELEIQPEPEVVENSGQKNYVFDTQDYLLKESAPMIPVYVFDHSLPADSEILSVEVDEEYFNDSEVAVPETVSLGHGSGSFNASLEYELFPGRTSRVNVTGNELEYVQAAMQKSGEKYRVLEKAHLEVRYRAPERIELEREGRTLRVETTSDTGRMVYRINGETGVEPAGTLEKTLEVGENRVELYWIDNGEKVDSVSRMFEVRKEVEVYLFGEDVPYHGSREFVAVFRNPNNVSVEKSFRLETGSNTVPGLMQSEELQVALPPHGEIRKRLRVFGTDGGEGEVSVAGANVSFNVTRTGKSRNVVSAAAVKQVFSTPKTEFRVEISQDRLGAVWRNSEAVFEHVLTPEKKTFSLETGAYRVKSSATPAQEKVVVETEKGVYREVNGNVYLKGSLSKDVARTYISALESARKKFFRVQTSAVRKRNTSWSTE
ncbi:MAG: hypothetical protein ABEJ69_03245, partial [Candidatus Nanohaloarchaea archaeon]